MVELHYVLSSGLISYHEQPASTVKQCWLAFYESILRIQLLSHVKMSETIIPC